MRNSQATLRTQHLEATSSAPRAARGSTGTLAAHGTGEEYRGRAWHTNRGRSGIPTVRCGGQPAQNVVRVSDMNGERNVSAPRGQQPAHMHPFRGGCLLDQLVQKSRGGAAESTNFRDRKGNEVDVGATPHPLRVLLKFGLLNAAETDVGRWGPRNAE
jgi:hypothetical protein